MRKLNYIVAAGALLVSTQASAQDSLNWTVGASTSYTFDVNDPDLLNSGASPGISENQKLYANFEQDESVNIDLVQIGIDGQRGPVMFGAKVDFGDLAFLAGDDAQGDVGLQEAYLGIDLFEMATFTAGRFGTPIGYESLEPWANPNISRSRAWTWQPINHDGATISTTVGNEDFSVDLLGGPVNSFFLTDQAASSNNPDDEFGLLGAASIGTDLVSLSLSGIWSEEGDTTDFYEANAILGGVCGNCRWAVESTYFYSDPNSVAQAAGAFETEVWDITAYAGLTIGDCTIDGRIGWTDEDYDSAGDVGIFSATLTGGYYITDGVLARVEYRYDNADEDIFDDDDTPGSNPDEDIHVLQAQIIWTPTIGS